MIDDTEQAEIDAAWEEALALHGAAPNGETQLEAEDPAAEHAAEDLVSEEAEPAAETAQDEAATPPPNTDPETVPTNDIWANATPEQKAAFDAAIRQTRTLEHRVKSDEGRVSRFQRERDEALKKIGAATSVAEREDLEAYLASEDWQKTKAEYGNDLGGLFKLVETLAVRDQVFEQKIGQFDELQAAKVANENEEWLDREAPDRGALAARDDFIPWLETQPQPVRDMVTRNWDGVVDATEVKLVFDLFRPQAYLADQRKSPTPEPEPQPQEHNRKRAVQLEGSKSHATKAPLLTRPDADDEDAAWDEATAAIERRQAAR